MEWLKDKQPQADRFRAMLVRAQQGEIALMMSLVNVGEVYYISIKEWGREEADRILLRLEELPIDLLPITYQDVLAAARLKAPGRISYADGFAAALAIREDCPLVTGDIDFRMLEYAGVLRLEWLGA